MNDLGEQIVDLNEVEYLGQFASLLRLLRAKGWARESIMFCVDRVYWEETD